MTESKTRRRRGPRTPLSRDRVLAQAITLADAGGLEAVSMRKVAQALKVEAMSLYNHVANKDALLDGMVDVVFGEIGVAFAEAEGWQAQMRARAEAAHATLMRHPWAAMLFMSRINVGPCALCYVDTTLRCLRGAGFSWPAADHAWNALDAFVYGFTLQQLAFPFQPDEYAGAAEDFLPQLPPDAYPDLVALSREVMAGRHDGLHSLSFGLELILAGLEGLRGRLGSVELGPRISTTC